MPSVWTLYEFGEVQKLFQALEGLVGVACIADGILIYRVRDTLDEATRDRDKNLSSLLIVTDLRCIEEWVN